MEKHFICTAGTSILGNKAREATEQTTRALIRERIQQESGSPDYLRKLSAETNSLISLGVTDDDRVTFLVTDTGVGKECALQLQEIVRSEFHCEVGIEVVIGLQVENAKLFRHQGISNLFETITKLRARYPISTTLNVTGGFKSVVPYTALYGLFFRIDLAYLFEFSSELIMLPPAPVGVDYEKAGQLRGFLLRLKEEGILPLEDFKAAIEKVPFEHKEWMNCLVCQEDGQVYLSAFGQIVVETAQQQTLPVLVSSNAEKSMKHASGSTEKQLHLILQKIGNPLWRNTHIDAGWNVTDLLVSKPGNIGERAAFFLKGGKVHVCELYYSHDEYERHLRTRNVSDYISTQFSPYVCPEGLADIEEADELLVRVLNENQKLTDTIKTLEESNGLLRKKAEEIEEKWVVDDDVLRQLKLQLETSKPLIEQTKKMQTSFIKRLRFLFSGKL
jgi:putative CRISPR-associated protein (TIGR02619 family)